MWAFQYKHGDRPLEGYTIQRAAGRGGFGEVYYAVSDSGREVALKVVQGYQDIELRGISQCMNLKSPHLVTIFDVKHNAEGKPFVLMEYVAGPNLRQLIDESPAGLGTQKSAFFLREIAKGLTFLHECGIVHRDLKPANIFYENGYVKIGDYGLSKHITASQYSGQTVTVGTVHYMAPEIGAGKYDRSIDIYAMGAVLYEMLTGMPPYVGASTTEVLMKHLSSEPDVTNIPQPFARVIQKAMAKDPAVRYRTVQEMVEDVFGAEHVRQSVSVFSTEDLSVIAERVAKKAPVAVGAGVAPGAGGPSSSLPGGAPPDEWGRLANWMDGVGGRVKQMWHEPAVARSGVSPQSLPNVVNDPLSPRHRWQLAILVSLVAPLTGMLISPTSMGMPVVTFLFVLLATWGGVSGLLIAHRTIIPRMGNDSVWVQRLVAGQMLAAGAVLFSLLTWIGGDYRKIGATLLAVIAPYLVFSSKEEMAWDRAERVGFGHLFGAGFAAFILTLFFKGYWPLAVAISCGITLLAQVVSPWDPVAGARTKERKESEEEEEASDTSSAPAPPPAPAPVAAAALQIDPRTGQVQQIPLSNIPAAGMQPGRTRYWSRPVWPLARIAWLVAVVAFITMGVMFCVAGAMTRSGPDEGPLVATGVVALLFGALTIRKALQGTFYGWWGYLIKPVLMILCVGAIVASAIVFGTLTYQPGAEEVMIATFFIVFPAVLLVVLLFIPGKFIDRQLPPVPRSSAGASRHRRSWALLLCGAFFFTMAGGLHRLYVGRIRSGIVWLATLGLLGIGQIVDLVMILTGKFTDAAGRPVLAWDLDAPLNNEPPPPAPAIQHIEPPVPGPGETIKSVVADCYGGVRDGLRGAVQSVNASVARLGKRDYVRSISGPNFDMKFGITGMSGTGGIGGMSGIYSALAGLLIFTAMLVALGLAIDVPGMLHAGVPTADVKRDLETSVFRDFDDWPRLMRQAAMLTLGILLVVALPLLMFARRNFGGVHMVRGTLGVAGLMLAMLPLSGAFQRQGGWKSVGLVVSHKQYAEAADLVLQNLRTEHAVFAGVIFIVSIIILAWPPRKAGRSVAPHTGVAPPDKGSTPQGA